MQLCIGVDYELFFGNPTGTPERCMLEPTQALSEVLERHGAFVTLFVDAAYLQALEASGNPKLLAELDAIADQLKALSERGHDVQLHLHPHWLDSRWHGDRWQIDTGRYRLHDFDDATVRHLVRSCIAMLERISGRTPRAYRAGGWCLQPFAQIADTLYAAGIDIDSTVYRGGFSVNPGREFDFRDAPEGEIWRFDTDPLEAAATGRFVELPISTVRVSPTFYWKMLLSRLRRNAAFEAYGDGSALSGSSSYYLTKLTRAESSVASIDGRRASLLQRALRTRVEEGGTILNVMGHPKALTRDSLTQLDRFLAANRAQLTPVTIRDFAENGSLPS